MKTRDRDECDHQAGIDQDERDQKDEETEQSKENPQPSPIADVESKSPLLSSLVIARMSPVPMKNTPTGRLLTEASRP